MGKAGSVTPPCLPRKGPIRVLYLLFQHVCVHPRCGLTTPTSLCWSWPAARLCPGHCRVSSRWPCLHPAPCRPFSVQKPSSHHSLWLRAHPAPPLHSTQPGPSQASTLGLCWRCCGCGSLPPRVSPQAVQHPPLLATPASTGLLPVPSQLSLTLSPLPPTAALLIPLCPLYSHLALAFHALFVSLKSLSSVVGFLPIRSLSCTQI